MCCYAKCVHKRWAAALSLLFIFECYLNIIYHKTESTSYKKRKDYSTNISDVSLQVENFQQILKFCANITIRNATNTVADEDVPEPRITYYEYPLKNSTHISMDYQNGYNSSYYWFMAMKPFFKNLGDNHTPRHSHDKPICQVNQESLGAIIVNKTKRDIRWVEEQYPNVKLGGYYAPAHCRAVNRVAIIVSYRNRSVNVAIFLYYIHALLQKQLLEYRIFVVEQYGTGKFNKGTLYNIAFLESQRFGAWHCLVFHDVDLIPEDERISYACPEHPTHMSSAVEAYNYTLPYDALFGGVSSLTPAHYEAVNGYSNCYWNWGGEDDDMQQRLISKNLTMMRYNESIGRYATLTHPPSEFGNQRQLFVKLSKFLHHKEGLVTTKYNLLEVTEEKLYTHILAEVNPTKIKLDTKSLMHYLVKLHGKSIEYGRQELQLRAISAKELFAYLSRERNKAEQDYDERRLTSHNLVIEGTHVDQVGNKL